MKGRWRRGWRGTKHQVVREWVVGTDLGDGGAITGDDRAEVRRSHGDGRGA